MKGKLTRKVLAFMLTLAMVMTYMPTLAFATEEGPNSDPAVTEETVDKTATEETQPKKSEESAEPEEKASSLSEAPQAESNEVVQNEKDGENTNDENSLMLQLMEQLSGKPMYAQIQGAVVSLSLDMDGNVVVNAGAFGKFVFDTIKNIDTSGNDVVITATAPLTGSYELTASFTVSRNNDSISGIQMNCNDSALESILGTAILQLNFAFPKNVEKVEGLAEVRYLDDKTVDNEECDYALEFNAFPNCPSDDAKQSHINDYLDKLETLYGDNLFLGSFEHGGEYPFYFVASDDDVEYYTEKAKENNGVVALDPSDINNDEDADHRAYLLSMNYRVTPTNVGFTDFTYRARLYWRVFYNQPGRLGSAPYALCGEYTTVDFDASSFGFTPMQQEGNSYLPYAWNQGEKNDYCPLLADFFKDSPYAIGVTYKDGVDKEKSGSMKIDLLLEARNQYGLAPVANNQVVLATGEFKLGKEEELVNPVEVEEIAEEEKEDILNNATEEGQPELNDNEKTAVVDCIDALLNNTEVAKVETKLEEAVDKNEILKNEKNKNPKITSATATSTQVKIKLEGVKIETKQQEATKITLNTAQYDVKPWATITTTIMTDGVEAQTTETRQLTNEEIKSGVTVRFAVPETTAKMAKITHTTDDEKYDTEEFYAKVEGSGSNQYVEIVMNHFSEVKIELLEGETENPVAAIGTTGYATMEEAFEAMEPTDTIILLKDYDIGTTTQNVSKSGALDLNGHTLSGTVDDYGILYFSGSNAITFRISDSSSEQTGKIVNRSIYGGNYTSALEIYNNSAKVTIDGGYYEGANESMLVNTYNGSTAINGGTFRGKILFGKGSSKSAIDTFTVESETKFIGYDPASILKGNQTRTVSDNTYTVVDYTENTPNVVAKVEIGDEGKYFTDLQKAVKDYDNGKVTLLDDVNVGSTCIEIIAGGATALDLNGHTITGSINSDGVIYFPSKSSLPGFDFTICDTSDEQTGAIINNGSGTSSYLSAIENYNTKVKLTIDGGLYQSANVSVYTKSQEGTVINGGTFVGGFYADSYALPLVTVANGTKFIDYNPMSLLNNNQTYDLSENIYTVIAYAPDKNIAKIGDNGYKYLADAVKILKSDESLTVLRNTDENAILPVKATLCVAEGITYSGNVTAADPGVSKIVNNADGSYYCKPVGEDDALASIGTDYFYQLSAAAKKAVSGDTINLLKNSSENVAIAVGVIFHENGGVYSGTLTAKDSATSTIDTNADGDKYCRLLNADDKPYFRVDNADGSTDAYFNEVTAAVTRANSIGNGTVVLLKNYNGQLIMPDNGKLTLDLNGNTITSSVGTSGTISIQKYSNLTIIDSSEDQTGSIENTASSSGRGIFVNASTLTLNAGNIYGKHSGIYVTGVSATSGVATLNNGTVIGGTYSVYANSSSKTNINGGTYKTSVHTYAGVTTVTGGMFEKTFSSPSTTRLKISGGYYPENSNYASYIIDGYKSAATDETDTAKGINTTIFKNKVVENPEYYKAAVLKSDGTLIKKYTTLQSAFTAAASQQTVQLLNNVDIGSDAITIENKAVTLDLNGCNISSSNSNNVFYVTGTAGLTIKGTGAITNTSGLYGILIDNFAGLTVSEATITGGNDKNSAGVALKDYAELTVKSGTITGGNAVALFENAELTVEGGILKGNNGFGIVDNGSESPYTTINVNGGKIEGQGAGIYHPGGGPLTVTDGDISGMVGVYTKSGTTTISGGSIRATGQKQDYEYVSSGMKVTGDALVIDNCGYPSGAPVVSVTGGAFYSTNANAVASYAYGKDGDVDRTPINGFLKGGIFGADTNAIDISNKDLIAEGYEDVLNEDEDTKADYPWMIGVAKVQPVVDKDDVQEASEVASASIVSGCDDTEKGIVSEAIESAIDTIVDNEKIKDVETKGDEKVAVESMMNNHKDGEQKLEGIYQNHETTIEVELEMVEVTTIPAVPITQVSQVTVGKAVYEVTPKATVTTKITDGQNTRTEIKTVTLTNKDLKDIGAVKVRLAVPETNAKQAKVTHHSDDPQFKEDEIFYTGVLGEKPEQYVEIEMTHFSKVTVETLDKVTDEHVAVIGTTGYATLADAIAAVQTGETITMLKDCTSQGISIPATKNFTLNLDGHTVSFGPAGAGSQATQTAGLQILQGAKVAIKNGTINMTRENRRYTWNSDSPSKGIARLIQNYADLTLDGVELDGTNIAHNNGKVNPAYLMSFNCGNVTIKDSKVNPAYGDVAFDSCKYDTYAAPTVNVTGTTKIYGDVDVTGGTLNLNDSSELVGNIISTEKNVQENLAKVSKEESAIVTAPEGYMWSGEDHGNLVPVAAINVNTGAKYTTLALAFAAVTDDTTTTIKVMNDCVSAGISVPSGRNITLDLNNKTVSFEGPGAGSANTKTNGLQLLKDSNIVIKNGKLDMTEANKNDTWVSTDEDKGIAMLIQNYANLTLQNVEIDGTNIAHNGTPGTTRYIVSTNAGNTVINNTKIKAVSGDYAFDAYDNPKYATESVTEVIGNSEITGNVEIDNGTLKLTSGTLTGELKAKNVAAGKVTRSATFTATAPEGYKWDNNVLVPVKYVAQIVIPANGETSEQRLDKYETAEEALRVVNPSDGQHVEMIADSDESSTNFVLMNQKLDLNSHNLKVGTMLVIDGRVIDSNTTKGSIIVSDNKYFSISDPEKNNNDYYIPVWLTKNKKYQFVELKDSQCVTGVTDQLAETFKGNEHYAMIFFQPQLSRTDWAIVYEAYRQLEETTSEAELKYIIPFTYFYNGTTQTPVQYEFTDNTILDYATVMKTGADYGLYLKVDGSQALKGVEGHLKMKGRPFNYNSVSASAGTMQ